MPTKRTTPEHAPFVDSYLTLARLVRSLTTPADPQRNLAVRDAIEYLLSHCAFCGGPASALPSTHGPAFTVIACDRCYRSPVNPELARRVLCEPAFSHFCQRPKNGANQERKSA